MPITFPDALPGAQRTGAEVAADVFRLLADKIESDPSLLEIALANIERWLARGHTSIARLEGWSAMVLDAQTSASGMNKLTALLRDQSWEAVMWKEFSPFPGVLNKEELDRFKWTSAH